MFQIIQDLNWSTSLWITRVKSERKIYVCLLFRLLNSIKSRVMRVYEGIQVREKIRVWTFPQKISKFEKKLKYEKKLEFEFSRKTTKFWKLCKVRLGLVFGEWGVVWLFSTKARRKRGLLVCGLGPTSTRIRGVLDMPAGKLSMIGWGLFSAYFFLRKNKK